MLLMATVKRPLDCPYLEPTWSHMATVNWASD